MSATRQDIVKSAMEWLGTPYHHGGDVKGAGVDCAMLLVRVFCDLGLAPAFDPRPYKAQWFLHRDEPIYLGWIEKYATKVERADVGDIQLYTIGRQAAHGSIVVSDRAMIHAYFQAGRVIIDDRHVLDHSLHSCWSAF